MRKIHIILKIKKLQKEIVKAVNWNFGYCPSNDPYFDATLEQRSELMNKLKLIDEKEYWRIIYCFEKDNYNDIFKF